MSTETAWGNQLTVYVNGKRKTLTGQDADPRTTLLSYLRDNCGLTGTKLGCGEGGCGACTVMLSRFDTATQKVRHIAANACLTPVCAVDGMAVTTVEGIGGMRKGLHPVQQRIAALHGSQCGFCTPGIVMALYAFLREQPNATPAEIEDAMDGNLCRCTGYRPILDAAKSLSNNKAGGCCGGGGCAGCPCKEGAKSADTSTSSCCAAADACSKGSACCQNKAKAHPAPKNAASGDSMRDSCSADVISSLPSLNEAMAATGMTEPIFPPALLRYTPSPVCLSLTEQPAEGADSSAKPSTFTWHQPTNLGMLHALKKKFGSAARLIVGNTEVGIETRFKWLEYNSFVNPSHVAELNVLELDMARGGLRVGANVTINGLRDYIADLEKKVAAGAGASSSTALPPLHALRGLTAIKHMLGWFASNQIRNVACVAGNIVTASPISDLNPMLMACKAELRVSSSAGGVRDVPVDKFFVSYRKVDLTPEEVLESVFVPFTSQWEYVVPCKQARRREDDISIVTAGMRFLLEPVMVADGNGENPHGRGFWAIKDCTMSFGGMAPTTVSAKKTATVMQGLQWCSASVDAGMVALRAELNLPEQVPGGQAEYRMALSASFLFRSFIRVSLEVQQDIIAAQGSPTTLPAAPIIDDREKSAAEAFLTSHKPDSHGSQRFVHSATGGIQTADPAKVHSLAPTECQTRAPVGESVAHTSGQLQVSGEALYTDDIAIPANALHGALVMSTRARAKLVKVDPTPAESCPGFVQFFCAKDIPSKGCNNIGAVIKDEEVFATDEVRFYGAVIGLVLAETHEQAVYAARKVAVEYADLPPAVSVEEAIAAGSFYPTVHTIHDGDVDAVQARATARATAPASADGTDADDDVVVVQGESKIGSQEHFYLETNCTLVVPKDGSQLEIFASTQNATKTQMTCAHVVGIPANNVLCRVKRMGGGFGGKETKSVFISAAAAVGAHLTGRAVKINIERDVDMSTSGQRHAFVFKYKAGVHRKSGKLSFMDAELWNNGGFSLDLSQAVMDRALFHSDNCYKFPNMRVRGTVCKTNQPSHTAFRGFGGPQGMFLCDIVMDHLASAIKMDPLVMMERNLYKEGDRTHYGELIEDYYVPAMVEQMKELSEFARRQEEVNQFNAANRWKKRGISMNATKFGINFTAKFYNQGGALVLVYTDGTVLVSHGGTEMGQGLHTKVIQVAAQALGISESLVRVEETSTNAVANASPTAASMGSDLYGMAVLNACEQIRDRLKPVRAKMGDSATWAEIINAAYFDRVNLAATGFYAVPDARTGYNWELDCADNSKRGSPFNYYTQGVAVTEVEIDCLSGDCRILRADILMDVGKSINPAIDIGQIEGAYIQGFGYSTMEEMVWGDSQHKWVRPGQLFTRGPGTYKIPAFNDVPLDMRCHLADTDNRFAVHSSKAVGEPPYYLGVAVFFAIKRAVEAARAEIPAIANSGEYFTMHAPATSERIRTACADAIMDRSCVNGSGSSANFQAKGSW